MTEKEWGRLTVKKLLEAKEAIEKYHDIGNHNTVMVPRTIYENIITLLDKTRTEIEKREKTRREVSVERIREVIERWGMKNTEKHSLELDLFELDEASKEIHKKIYKGEE